MSEVTAAASDDDPPFAQGLDSGIPAQPHIDGHFDYGSLAEIVTLDVALIRHAMRNSMETLRTDETMTIDPLANGSLEGNATSDHQARTEDILGSADSSSLDPPGSLYQPRQRTDNLSIMGEF